VIDPVVIAPDGRHLYLGVAQDGISPGSAGLGILTSADGSLHWDGVWAEEPYGGHFDPTPDPFASGRFYAVYDLGENGPAAVDYTAATGAGQTLGNPGGAAGDCRNYFYCPYIPGDALVADPLHPHTLYDSVVYHTNVYPGPFAFAARWDGSGTRWTMVMTPTATLRTFRVGADPHEGPVIVAQTTDKGIPRDRRYLSRDEGRTWQATICPGDVQGTCPAFTVDNLFGEGAAYGFVHDGIYRFHGGGAAEARLGASPFPVRTAVAGIVNVTF